MLILNHKIIIIIIIIEDTFSLIGNGHCVDNNGNLIHGEADFPTVTSAQDDGSSPECESLCSSSSGCIGYMVQGESFCNIIRSIDANAENGISSSNSDPELTCWSKGK